MIIPVFKISISNDTTGKGPAQSKRSELQKKGNELRDRAVKQQLYIVHCLHG